MNTILKEYRIAWDGGDNWGSAITFMFDIANELYMRELCIPAAWGYSPGCTDDPRTDSYGACICLDANDEELLRAGMILDRYCNYLISKELNY